MTAPPSPDAAALRPAARPAPPPRVYFFATCVVDLFVPQAGMDAIELIESRGVAVEFPRGQSCCGQPAYTSGFRDEAREVAAAQLGLFPEPWPIVVPSGSCAGMMRHHWPKLFEGDAARLAQAQAVGARVVELSAFLADTLGLPAAAAPAPRPVKVALHTSCSARREMGTQLPSRALLETLPGVEVVQQAREAECCGFGGTFSMRHPSISGAMAQDKLDAVQETGCDVLVSADCGCLLNLHHTAQKRGSGPRCLHLASFIRERLGLVEPGRGLTE
ncbi:(Fe-S)-binding protein [Caldimonas tepidiphila]|uniref:(Fe-S)-binding protein n=1 Tax=Caldimonas tepidiphila TaxID=2315841 RepID=UPI000E5A18DE|nr:(Fe-S)-binding protein [Caldimonas tepidiphila]